MRTLRSWHRSVSAIEARARSGEGLGDGMEFDYVIVGGGSAGCVLAGRLSADRSVTVCLIEAGPSDANVFCRVPFSLALMVPGKWRNWAFLTEPQPGLNGRRGYQPRRRMPRGSSGLTPRIS